VFLSSATRPYGFERAEVELKLAAGKIYRSAARPHVVDWSVLSASSASPRLDAGRLSAARPSQLETEPAKCLSAAAPAIWATPVASDHRQPVEEEVTLEPPAKFRGAISTG